jgi:alpha-L-fucosidase
MMQSWFPQAKLGIFIHWGIYAVKGIPESWSFYNRQISYEDYMAQCDGFTAKNYDPQAWADLFKRSGAQYAVLTTKHHDGVALWDTQQNDLSVVKKTPAARDLIGPYADALREQGLKVGFYFSHLDWSHPDYSAVPPENRHPDTEKPDGKWTLAPDSPQWQNFLNSIADSCKSCARNSAKSICCGSTAIGHRRRALEYGRTARPAAIRGSRT